MASSSAATGQGSAGKKPCRDSLMGRSCARKAREHYALSWLYFQAHPDSASSSDETTSSFCVTDGHQSALTRGLTGGKLYALALGNIFRQPTYRNLRVKEILRLVNRRFSSSISIAYGNLANAEPITETMLTFIAPIRFEAHLALIKGVMRLYLHEYAKSPAFPNSSTKTTYSSTPVMIINALQKFKQNLLGDELVVTNMPLKSTQLDRMLFHWLDVVSSFGEPSAAESCEVLRFVDGFAIARLISTYCPDSLTGSDLLVDGRDDGDWKSAGLVNRSLIRQFCMRHFSPESHAKRIFHFALLGDPFDFAHTKIESFKLCMTTFLADLFFYFEVYPIAAVVPFQSSPGAFTVRPDADGKRIFFISSNWHLSDSTRRAMSACVGKPYDVSLFGIPSPGEEGALRPICGHKAILEHASAHLYELLNSDNYTDSHQSVHHLENINHESLRRIVFFIYTNQLMLSANRFFFDIMPEQAIKQMCGVIIGAKYLVMTNLSPVEECEAFLVRHVDRVNCVKLWCFARKYSCEALMHATSTLIATNLAGMPNDVEFLRMPYKDLEMLLPSNAFAAIDADQQCLAATAWLESDSVDRASYVSDVMNMIPLVSVSAAAARTLNDSEMLWAHAPGVMRKLVSALLDKLEKKKEESVSGNTASLSNASSWYVMGGRHDSQKLFLQYNISERMWTTLPALPWNRRYFGACSGGGRLMLMGGVKNDASTADIDEFDLASKTWSTSTVKLRAATIGYEETFCDDDQFAYALGSRCRGVKKYCLRSNKIKNRRTSMVENRSFYAAALTNECIYVTGGKSNPRSGSFRDVVEKYDIERNRWAIVGNVLDRHRLALAGTITGDDFYLMGGHTDRKISASVTDTVEIFNIRTGQCRMGGQKLLQARTGCRATTMDNGNVICVVGGRRRGGGGLKSVETFDKREGTWSTGTIVVDMPAPASYFGLATV